MQSGVPIVAVVLLVVVALHPNGMFPISVTVRKVDAKGHAKPRGPGGNSQVILITRPISRRLSADGVRIILIIGETTEHGTPIMWDVIDNKVENG
jgi:hypothetical protein